MNVSVPSQCSTPSKSSVRGRKREQPLSKKENAGEWNSQKSKTARGRKHGRPPFSTSKSRSSVSSPLRKSVKLSIRNKDQLPDTDKGTVKEVSTIINEDTTWKKSSRECRDLQMGKTINYFIP